ncbi:hypothetical protein MRX96_018654 [Rhipicephalus microplus]
MHAANVTNVTQQLREAGRAGFISGPVDMGWTDEVSLPLQRLPICPREQAEKLEARATGAEQLERTALEANIDLAGGNAPAAGRQRKKKVARCRLVREKMMGPPLTLSAQVICLPAALPPPPIDAERFLETGLLYNERRPDFERLPERERLPAR